MKPHEPGPVYTFTAEDLEQHDREIRAAALREAADEIEPGAATSVRGIVVHLRGIVVHLRHAADRAERGEP